MVTLGSRVNLSVVLTFRRLRCFGFTFFLFSACGPIHVGSPVAPNDLAPTSGTIVAQGSFQSQGGQTVSGTATVYQIDSAGNYVIRLAGLSVTQESGLQVIAVTKAAQSYPLSLRANSGNQNYSLGLDAPVVWKQINIHSTLKNTDYGEALLSSN